MAFFESVVSSMDRIEKNYRALLAVAVVLNSQRDMNSLWEVITAEITKVIPWARASVTLYDHEADGFRFYVMATTTPNVVLLRKTVVPRVGSGMGWAYDHKTVHIRSDLKQEQVFLEDQWYVQEGLGRMINLPLLVGDRCLGVLNIGSIESGAPDPGVLEFLTQVAIQIASAIDHVQAYEQIDRLRDQLAKENVYLTEELKLVKNMGSLVGQSPAFQHVLDLARQVAVTPTTVLITGETGTGKEVIAQAIHDWSPRQSKPLIRVNCASFPAGLVESELFGHERGAFTGADRAREGRFELADGGSLFLDEIGEMPLETQAKLLRVLQDGMIDRLGGKRPVRVDVRVIAATNKDLAAAVKNGTFRADLYYRLNVFPIALPPLRNRPEDIPLLARHFVEQYRVKLNRPSKDIDQNSLERLIRYTWPGNVRELENVIERAMILSHDPVLRIDDKALGSQDSSLEASPPAGLKELERQHILQTLILTNWHIEGPDGAAARLGLPPSTLRSRLKQFGIRRPPSD
ncbi:MAG TPA: sigma 54-interacting transcriptional regulator [Nitrospira sp.]|jgi:formate hydrogenlyase transcriptional activator|nr:sigma 54-interacting transcriptional regulator [Nitrospira sp.]